MTKIPTGRRLPKNTGSTGRFACLRRPLYFLFFLMALQLSSNHALAQKTKASGRIVDESTGEAVAGATVKVKGAKNGVTTDVNGNFSIDVSDNATLEISNVGYATQEVRPGQQLQVKLLVTNRQLNEVVVVGYGTKKKATLTGSVATVDAKVFQDRGAVSNPMSALQGQVPGVVVTRSSAAPGQEGWNFQMRGASSINGTDPLVIVDGIPLVSLNALNSINPADIDNMSFLKDAAAAIYGARAAGGVVLITTKKAKSGKATIQYSGSVSQKRMGLKPSFLPADQYGKYLYEAISNASAGAPDENWIWTKYAKAWMNRPDSAYIDKATPEYRAGGETIGFTDVFDYTFFDTNPIEILWGNGRAISNQHDLSLSARTSNMGYRLSLGYMDDGSMLKWGENSNKRYNVRLAYDYTFSPRFKMSTNISLEKNDIVIPSRQGEINFGSQPGFPVATKSGKPYAWGTQPARNWLLELGGENKSYNSRIFTNTRLDFNLAKDLNFIAQVGYNWSATDNQNQYKYIPEIYNYAETYQYQGNPRQDQSWYERGLVKDAYFNTNAYLEYKKTLKDDHDFNIVAGGSYERDEFNSFSTRSTYLANNEVPALDQSLLDAITRSTNAENRNHWAIASGFGRFNYDFKDKYLFEANVRYDGSSKFDADNRWKFYSGLSAGWRLSQEKFMKAVDFVNELKLRGSIGTVGNQGGIGLYDYIQLINLGAGGPILGGYSARSVTAGPDGTLVSLDRTWESIQSKNLGFDFSVLKSRLFGSFDYFWKENKNMLLPQTYPAVLGANAPTANIGHLKVWGWEMALGWKDRAGNVSYYINGTLTDNDNKLVNYGGRNVVTAGLQTIEGYPLGSYFGYVYGGRIQTDKQAEDYAKLVPGSSIGNMPSATQMIKGINMFRDVNGDGKLTNAGANQYLLGKKDANGNPIPDGDVVYLGRSDARYVFGLNMGAEWKGFDFSAIFQGVGQRNIFRRSDWSTPFGTIWQGHGNWWVGKTWTPENPDAPLPILTTATNKGFGGYAAYNYQISDWSMQNGAYVRLKNLVVGYTLPQAISQKAKIEKLRVYFSGNDLWEITKVEDNWDPEQTAGISGGAQRYPFFRLLTFGVNVTF
jgi:TonB-linked SusC/RagA family outer membrane protein